MDRGDVETKRVTQAREGSVGVDNRTPGQRKGENTASRTNGHVERKRDIYRDREKEIYRQTDKHTHT